MKREYKKPVLAVESFQLDAAIAGSCSNGIAIGHYQNTCGYGQSTYSKWAYFNYDNCDEDLTGEMADGNDTICYHGPIGVVLVWS